MNNNIGKKSLKFGKVEAKASLNWQSLLISLVVALLSWISAELVPYLSEYGGTIAVVSGLFAQIIPVLVLWLRNNQDLVIDNKKSPPEEE